MRTDAETRRLAAMCSDATKKRLQRLNVDEETLLHYMADAAQSEGSALILEVAPDDEGRRRSGRRAKKQCVGGGRAPSARKPAKAAGAPTKAKKRPHKEAGSAPPARAKKAAKALKDARIQQVACDFEPARTAAAPKAAGICEAVEAAERAVAEADGRRRAQDAAQPAETPVAEETAAPRRSFSTLRLAPFVGAVGEFRGVGLVRRREEDELDS